MTNASTTPDIIQDAGRRTIDDSNTTRLPTTIPHVDDDRQREYAAYDALPAPIREALRSTVLEMSAVDVARAWRGRRCDPTWLAADILRRDSDYVADLRRRGEFP